MPAKRIRWEKMPRTKHFLFHRDEQSASLPTSELHLAIAASNFGRERTILVAQFKSRVDS
jgi:hypothetical protein